MLLSRLHLSAPLIVGQSRPVRCMFLNSFMFAERSFKYLMMTEKHYVEIRGVHMTI